MAKRSQCVPNTPREQARADAPKPQTYLGEELRVNSIDQWRQVDADWWEHRPVNRAHYRVTLEDGRSLEVFKNMDHGGWYRLIE